MPSLNSQCQSAFMIVCHGVLDDANWRPFGFRRRPRRGKIFNHFVPRKRLEKETVLLQELYGAFFSQISYWIAKRRDFSFRIDFLARLFEFCLGDDLPLWPSLRFTSLREAVEFLRDTSRDYILATPPDHTSVFLKRCDDRLAQDLPKVWAVGAAWLFAHPTSLLKNVGRALDEAGVAKNPASDIQVCNKEYIKLAHELVGQRQGHEMEREGKLKPFCSSSQTGQPDPLLERAEILVQTAQINAVGMFTPLLERFPILREIDVEHSDFILTVASVFMAVTRLNNLRLGDEREEKFMEVVAERLDQWYPDGIRGFEDCKGLFESEFDRLTEAGHEPRFVASDALGKWIVWNMLGRPPQTYEECMIVRATGGMVTHAFFDWWDK